MPGDLVGLDGVVLDGQADGDVAAHKGQRDGHYEPHQHDAEVHADGHGTTSPYIEEPRRGHSQDRVSNGRWGYERGGELYEGEGAWGQVDGAK